MGNVFIQDGLLVLGLSASLCLFLSAKREIHREARRHKQAVEDLAAKLGARLTRTLRDIPEPLPEPLAETTAASFGWTAQALRSGFNLNRRAQALRLLRRGHDIAHVSAALGVPQREIELLIRVQQLAAARSTMPRA